MEEIKIACYRFTVRWLFAMKVTPENVLADWLAEEQFWVSSKPFVGLKEVEEMLQLPLSKIGSLLNLLKFEEQKTDEQIIEGPGNKKEVKK